jgi:hypothetical protein
VAGRVDHIDAEVGDRKRLAVFDVRIGAAGRDCERQDED